MKIFSMLFKLQCEHHCETEITKGHKSIKILVKLCFISAHRVMMFKYVPSILTISQRVSESLSGHNFHTKINKGT